MQDGSHSRRTATMFEYGDGTDVGTAMSRTVGITTAIGAQMVLDKTIPSSVVGVHRPFLPEIYNSALALLEKENIRLTEKLDLAIKPIVECAAPHAAPLESRL